MIDTRMAVSAPVTTPLKAAASAPLLPEVADPMEQVTWSGKAADAPEGKAPRPQGEATPPEAQVAPAAPFGPLPIDRRVPLLTQPIATALGKHWDFLYSRNDPARPVPDPNKGWCDLQRAATASGVDHALAQLRAKGHEPGTGKVAVLGGGYEVDLGPLLEEFAEVHVVDLSDKPFPVVERQNVNDPNRDRLRFIQTDLSGIDPMYQGVEIQRLHDARSAGKEFDPESMKTYLGNLPELGPSRLDTGGYTMVVAPVLTEGMAFGPMLTDMEARRDQRVAESGLDDSQNRRSTWNHVSTCFKDEHYFDPQVSQGFDKLFLHQSKEIDRLLEPGGVGVVSFWTRPDERKPDSGMHRLGDNSVTTETFQSFFTPFAAEKLGEHKIYGPESKPTVHVYSLSK